METKAIDETITEIYEAGILKFAHLILSFLSAAITTGKKGCSKAALVPVSNFVSQLAIFLCSLLTAENEDK